MNMPMVRLKEVAKFVNGKAFQPTDWSEAGVPIIRIQNLNGLNKPFNYWAGSLDKEVCVRQNDLLLAWSGTPGTSFGAHIWGGDAAVLNQHIFRVDLNEKLVTKEWTKFVINAQLSTLIGLAHGGVGLKHVTKGMVEELEIPAPPLPEQRRIAAILDQADALRAKRREALAQLDSLTQSIFIEMFGDPISNPKKWTTCVLESVCKKITDGTHKTPIYVDSGVEFLSAKDLKNERIVWGSGKFITKEEHTQLIKRCNPELGDVLLAKSGSLGAVAVIDRDHEFSLFESLCLVKHARSKIVGQFLVGLLRAPSMLTHLLGKNKGIAIKHLHLVDVRSLAIPLPPIELQEEYANRISAVERVRDDANEALLQLEVLCASLQHRAFRGEL